MRRRKQIRLKEYNYSNSGSYFFTICARDRINIFGEIVNGEMIYNDNGKIVQSCWDELTEHYKNILLDEFMIMPNHVHGIIIMMDDIVGAIHVEDPPYLWRKLPLQNIRRERRKMLLPKIIGRFKHNSAKQINIHRNTEGQPVWQRNYYDHVVRNERSMNRIREYIRTNPEQWSWDKENPLFKGKDKFDNWLSEEGKNKITTRIIV